MNLWLTLAYQGTRYAGLQSQAGQADTIQENLVGALARPLRLPPEDFASLRFAAAGRTDAGVHARGQAVNLHLNRTSCEKTGLWNSDLSQLEDQFPEFRNWLAHPVEGGLPHRRPGRFPEDQGGLVSTQHRVFQFFRAANQYAESALDRLTHSANSLLPPDIQIQSARIVPNYFHARFSCLGRSYKYLVYNRKRGSPFWRERALHTSGALDQAAMRQAMTHLTGVHDFAAFTRAVYKEERTVRRLDNLSLEASREFSGLLTFSFAGSGFLHNMIRILMGCLLRVGRGEESPEWLAEVRDSRERTRAADTVPPTGLYFERAWYPAVYYFTEKG